MVNVGFALTRSPFKRLTERLREKLVYLRYLLVLLKRLGANRALVLRL